jgi:hypothetical protein
MKALMPKHTLYFSDKLFDRIALDPAGVEGLSSRVSHLCTIAIEVMREATPELPLNEWEALLDISNGHFRSSDFTLSEQVESFRYGVSESGPECNEKWGIDCPTLARKLAGMTLAEQCAIMEICRKFWMRSEINAKYDTFKDMLLAHGARITEAEGE